MRLTIKAKVFSLALIPPLLIAVFLTWYNLSQSTQVAQNAVSDFKSQMQKDAREEVRNYLQLAMSSIEHLVADDSLGSLQERQERAKQILRQLRFDGAAWSGRGIFLRQRLPQLRLPDGALRGGGRRGTWRKLSVRPARGPAETTDLDGPTPDRRPDLHVCDLARLLLSSASKGGHGHATTRPF